MRIDYPNYTEKFSYDKRGRKTLEKKMVNGKTQVTRFEYDQAGNLVSKTDPKGRTTEKEYNALGKVIRKVDPAGGVTKYEYDSRGNLVRLTDPNGQTTRFEYNLNDELIKKIRPMGESTSYSYDNSGNLVEKIDAKGQKIEYEYNESNKLSTVRYYNASNHNTPVRTVQYGYDAAGHLISYQDGTTSARYSYDSLGRRTGSTVDYGPFKLGLNSTYANNTRKKSLTYPDGSTYRYSYNSDNRLESVDLPGSGQISLGDYKWKRPTQVTLPGGSTRSYNYDPLQRIKGITSKDPGGNTVMQETYDYDSAGNIITEQTGKGEHQYSYDQLDRLSSADNPVLSDEKYSYDAVGNRLSSIDTNGSWEYNLNNALSSYDNASCSYDDNGNLVKRVVDGETTRYFYNVNNRLIRIEDGSGNVKARYHYDPFGRRLWKEVNGTRTYFLYSEQGLIGEYDSQGEPIRLYGYKPGSTWSTDPLFLKKDGSYYFYHNDHLGTPQKLTSSNGRTVWSANYESFGEAEIEKQEISNPLRFPGQYHDQETGLHYNYHRYYDPQVGRYLREDPIGLEGGINLFEYCLNSPINLMDPEGLFGSHIPGDMRNPVERRLKDLGDEVDRKIKEFKVKSKAVDDCIYCTAKCTVEVVLPSAVQSSLVKEVLLEAAEDLAKEGLEKAIPYYNVADVAVTSGLIADCAVTCVSKR